MGAKKHRGKSPRQDQGTQGTQGQQVPAQVQSEAGGAHPTQHGDKENAGRGVRGALLATAAAVTAALVAVVLGMVPDGDNLKGRLLEQLRAASYAPPVVDRDKIVAIHLLENGVYNATAASGAVPTNFSAATFEDLLREYTVFDPVSGENITSLAGLSPDTEHTLLRVPRRLGVHFMWPAPYVGYRTTLPFPRSPSGKPLTLEVIARYPRAFVVRNFLSDEEADELIRKAHDPSNPYRMRRSTTGTESWTSEVGDPEVISDRTSENAFDVDSPNAMRILRRCFDLLRVPWDRDIADGLQIVRYAPGQAYKAHMDAYEANTPTPTNYNFDPARGGSNRYATVFIYLRDIEHGGQTFFPAGIIEGRNNSDENGMVTGPKDMERRIGRLPESEQAALKAFAAERGRGCVGGWPGEALPRRGWGQAQTT